MLIYPLHKSTSNHRKIGIWNIFGRSWWWLEWLEPVEPLYKEHQWHTSEDSTMCESKPAIGYKTLPWTRCNSHQGMHKHIPMPRRYFTNVKEPFCLLSDAPSRLSQSYSQFTYLGILSHNVLSDLTVRLPSTFGTVYRDRLWRYLTQCNDMGKHGKKSVYSLSQTKKLSFASDRIWL